MSMQNDEPRRRRRRRRRGRSSLILVLICISALAIFSGYIAGKWMTRKDGVQLTTVDVGGGVDDVLPTRGVSQHTGTRPPTSFADDDETTVEESPMEPAPGEETPPTATDVVEPVIAGDREGASQAPSEAVESVLYRVRVGAFGSRSEAQTQVDTLKEGDPPIDDAFITYDAENGVYRVQVGSFRRLDGANALADQLAEQGFNPIIAR